LTTCAKRMAWFYFFSDAKSIIVSGTALAGRGPRRVRVRLGGGDRGLCTQGAHSDRQISPAGAGQWSMRVLRRRS